MALKTVYVELVAETSKLNSGLKQADKRLEGFTKGVRRLSTVLAGAFAGRKLFNDFKATILDADKLIKTARAVGVVTNEYEKLSFVIEKRLGGSAGTTERLFKFLQVRLGDAGKTYDKYFKQAGLDPNKLRKESPSDQALSVIAALSKIENATTRTAVASRLLGEEVSLQVLKVAAAGAGAIKDAADDYDRIGSALGKPGAAAAIETLVDEAANLERSFEVLRQTVVLEAAPQITSAIESISGSGAIKAIANDLADFVFQINLLIKDIKELGLAWDLVFSSPNMPKPEETSGKWLERLLGLGPADVSKWGDTSNGIPVPPEFSGGMTGQRGVSAASNTTINQNNTINVTDRAAVRAVEDAIRKSNERVFREAGWTP